ncbi:hypothetical protein LCGC14_0345890 [marine sediment metagenome]|uniref:Uncharacterized protein n=1 Tax=marine sediment metagenome TaxID=412755 RepID=A0A0F9TV54_9ZZZZ
MERRNFLKLIAISPIAPSVLMAKEKAAEIPAYIYDRALTDKEVSRMCNTISDDIYGSPDMLEPRQSSVYVIQWGNDKIHFIYPKELDIQKVLKEA